MPRIFDNIDKQLLPTLRETLEVSDRADFCVGYFNLRGWKQIDSFIERWPGGEGNCCRLLVGMHRSPDEELRKALSLTHHDDGIDNQTAIRLRKTLAEEFRAQLTVGVPTDEDERGLRRLAHQIKDKKVVVKLFLRHTLHAKLYLLFRPDPVNPSIGFVGSSNLTFAGLSQQGELNVDVMDHDACQKLAKWFEERWNDKWCLDISDELVQIIEESWAREDLIPPYHIYVKMAYHLSQEARAGLAEFKIPRDFGNKLFEFQKAAVKIAAHRDHQDGVTDPAERARLRAELDGMIAHLYGLTEEEFVHILLTFPLVEQSAKDAALDAYREFAPKPGDQEIAALIAKGESATLEFKSSARWDMKQNKADKLIEGIVVKTVAALLNSAGGALLLGVDDDRNVIGLAHDYKLFGKKDSRDAYENFLTGLLLNNLGKYSAALISITFHELDGKDVCKVEAKKSPKPVFVKDAHGEHLYIRAGNSTRLLSTREAIDYCKIRWR